MASSQLSSYSPPSSPLTAFAGPAPATKTKTAAEQPLPRPELAGVTEQDFPAFLMSPPYFLSTDAANNIWMQELSPEDRCVSRIRALAQFRELYQFLASRALVYLLPSRPGLQDQAYVANLGVVLPHTPEKTVVISNFRSVPRRGEREAGLEFFQQLSLSLNVAPPFFEGEADLKHLGDNTYVGAYGLRTSREALRWFERTFDMHVIPFRMENEYLYHLDCSVFPIATGEVLVCTENAEAETLAEIERHASIVDVSLDDAETGITNCVRIGEFVLCASNIEELSSRDEAYPYERSKIRAMEEICAKRNLTPVSFNLSEFLKSGAMLSCLIMHLNRANF